MLEGIWQDARYAVRLLRRSPVVTVTAALSVAIGIATSTAVFAVANGMVLREPNGVAEPDRLVDIVRMEEGHGFGVFPGSYPEYLELRRNVSTFDGLYGYRLELDPMSLAVSDVTGRVFASLVTTNYFSVLGVRPAAGRVFGSMDSEEPGASPVVVLSYRLWMRRFNGDPAIVGQTVLLNRQAFTVIGVAPDGFLGTTLLTPDVWAPVTMIGVLHPEGGPSALTSRANGWLMVGGRLKAGVSHAQASANVDVIGRAFARDNPNTAPAVTFTVARTSPIPAGLRGVAARFLTLLMAVVSLVLVIACTNVAGVLLARAAARRREIAVRAAIGATRARVVRQLLVESLLLFALAAAVSVPLARITIALLTRLLPASPLPITLTTPLDGRVLAFALGVAAIAALLSGLAPAFHVAKTNVVSALKDDAHGLMDRLSLRKTFVVAQVGFSFLLVVTTGLLLQGLSPLRALDQGFESAGVQVLSIDLSTGGYTNTSGRIFARQLVERIRSVPGIASATLADRLPGQGRRSLGRLIVPGVAPPNRQPFLLANWNVVEPGYFSTLRIPLLAGRDFNADDHESAPLVAIINESAAIRFWPGTDAVGQFMFWQPGPLNAPVNQEAQKRLLVVGVARDVGNTFDRGNVPAAVLYVPLQQHYMPGLAILARQAGKEDMSGALGTLLESIDPNLPVLETGTLDRQQSGPVVTQLRVAASVAGSMGLIGLLLASIGIYGITAYTVTRRTREIGIRLSLGARPGHVLAMILGQGLSLVFIGAALGLVMSVGASRFVGSILAGVPSLGPLTVATAILVFAGIGTTACIVPALRATRIDPVAALRAE